MSLRYIGFFKEIAGSDQDAPNLLDYISDKAHSHVNNIIFYLQHGVVYFGSPGTEVDAINPSNGIAGTSSILTDGIWCWPDSLAYYVWRYHLVIPNEFIVHMQNNNWQVPEIDVQALENSSENDRNI